MTGDLFLLAAVIVNDPCKSLQSRRQLTKPVSKLVFYAQSTDAVISGRYTSLFFFFLIMCVCLKMGLYTVFKTITKAVKQVKQLFKEFKAKHKSVCVDISQA